MRRRVPPGGGETEATHRTVDGPQRRPATTARWPAALPRQLLSRVLDAWVNHCVDHVCEQTAEQDRHSADQIDCHDDRVVASLHGRQSESADAWPGEDRFDDDCAA